MLQKLKGQKMKQIMLVSDSEVAFDFVMKWRYDDVN